MTMFVFQRRIKHF